MANSISKVKIGTSSKEIIPHKITDGGSYTATSPTLTANRTLPVSVNNKFAGTNGNISITSSDIKGGYLGIHPENSPTIIPFINNDLAFFKARGGVWTNYTVNSASINFTIADLSAYKINTTQVAESAYAPCFDGSPSYSFYTSSTYGVENGKPFVIDLTLPKTFTWGNTFYIDFGSLSWKAQSIKVLTALNNSVYTSRGSIINNSSGFWTCACSSDGSGFNKIRIVLDLLPSSFRIAAIGLLNYDSQGLRTTYMSRGVDDQLYRSITPAITNAYSLGSSSKQWDNIYGKILYQNGKQVANAEAVMSIFDTTPNAGLIATTTNTKNKISYSNQTVTDIVNIASGATKSYTLSYADSGNGAFNSQNNSITLSAAITIKTNGGTESLALNKLKKGDILLVTETEVPDRWVAIEGTSTVTLYKMETSKVDLTGYLPLTAGSSKTLTGDLYIKTNSTTKSIWLSGDNSDTILTHASADDEKSGNVMTYISNRDADNNISHIVMAPGSKPTWGSETGTEVYSGTFAMLEDIVGGDNINVTVKKTPSSNFEKVEISLDPSAIPSYTAGQNITISNGTISLSGTNSSPEYSVAIKGSATAANAVAIGYGTEGGNGGTAVGNLTHATGMSSIALGMDSVTAGRDAIGLGTSSRASAQRSVAIGYNARANADNAYQIGNGSNSTANTLQFCSTVLVNSNGKIPAANLDTPIPSPITSVDGLSGGTISSTTTINGAMKINGGRYVGSGDDEGLIIGRASNNYAGVILGNPSGNRVVLYLKSDNTGCIRYNNGTTSYDIAIPSKAGTMAVTSDIPTFSLSGTTLTITT